MCALPPSLAVADRARRWAHHEAFWLFFYLRCDHQHFSLSKLDFGARAGMCSALRFVYSFADRAVRNR